MKYILLVPGMALLLGMMASSSVSAVLRDDGPARKLINSQGCKACHSLEGDGGTAASSFEEIRAGFSREEIRQRLVNQDHRHGNGRIPDFSSLSEDEIEALVVFIQPQP